MQIFRQDKIELTRGDRRLIEAYLVVMALWLAFEFSVQGIPLRAAALNILIGCYEVLAAFFALKWLIERFFLQRSQWIVGLLLIVLALIVIGGSTLILITLVSGGAPREVLRPLGKFCVEGLYSSLLDVTILIGFLFSKKSYDQFVNNKNLAIQNRDNSLKILRDQFSPHFLFNNLNTIDALIEAQPELAKRYVRHLAALYRYLTETVNRDVMPVADELTFIRDYLFLIEVRFGEDYRFTIRVEQDVRDRYLPAGALQTAVENVVKHNAPEGQRITAEILVVDDRVRITNSRSGSTGNPGAGTGLENLSARYALLGATAPVVRDEADAFTLTLPLLLTS